MSDVLHDVVLPKLEGVRPSGGGYTARCPAHDDNEPSLSVAVGEQQPVILFCQVGCEPDAILAALGLSWADLCIPVDGPKRRTVEAEYPYTNEQGALLFVKVRMMPKDFRIKRPDGHGGWIWKIEDTRRVLYRLPQVLDAIANGRTVYVVEGEKDVHAAEKAGVTATCNFDGAAAAGSRTKWKPEYGDYLKGADVVIVADNDDIGRAHAWAAYADLKGKATSVRVVRGRVDVEKADLSDHLAAGHDLGDLLDLNGDFSEARPANPTMTSQASAEHAKPSSGISGTRSEEWEDPLPFDWPTKLPGWPSGVFPPVVAAFAAALAEDTQTPLDFVGVTVLGILAASVGGRVDVRCSTHTEPTNLFVVPVLPPGSRKSAVVAACRSALDAAEIRLLEDLGDGIRAERTKRKILEQYAEGCVRDASKDPTSDAIKNAQEAEKAAAAVPVRAFPRLVTSDATPEAMVTLLAEQGGRIAAISAEAGLFASLTGRYAKSPNLDPVLMSHAGDPIRVDRRSREPEKIERPALTLLASIQPYALLDMVARPDFVGRGLLARVLWSLPPDLVGRRKIRNVQPVPETTRAEFGLLVETLAVDMGKRTETLTVTVSKAAEEARLTYAEKVEKLLRPDGELGSHNVTREWGSKLAGAVLRIAGCLHAARVLEGLSKPISAEAIQAAMSEPISAETMRAAILVGEYFRAHAVGALVPRGDDTRIGNLQHVLTKLVDMDARTFTTRELHRKVQRKFPRTPQVTEVLEELAALGWLRPAEKGFVLHPDAKSLLDQAKNPGDSGDSGDNREETAGQATYGESPEPVTTPGDSGDKTPGTPGTVTAVTAPGDSFPAGMTVPLSRKDAGIVTAVTAVTGVERSLGSDGDETVMEWSA